MNHGLPFAGSQTVGVVLPDALHLAPEAERKPLADLARFLEEHHQAIEGELGASLSFAPDAGTATWWIGPGIYHSRPFPALPATGPTIHLDRAERILICDGTTHGEVIETFSHLRSLGTLANGTRDIGPCLDRETAIARIETEVATTYPSFALRGLDWQEICARFRPLVSAAADPIPLMQEWLAALEDGHTWVRPAAAPAECPYPLLVNSGEALVLDVPKESPGWRAGLRPGFFIEAPDLEEWWRRTASTPHCKPLLVGRRLLAVPAGDSKELTARAPDGSRLTWTETPSPPDWQPVLEWQRHPSGCGYMKLRAWLLGHELEERFTEAFQAMKGCSHLVVDLRGNPGGNLLLAHSFRNRFLDQEGPVGWIQNTLPDGELTPQRPILGIPAPEKARWHRPARFLTDPLTYSASEDALLGLQGRPGIEVIGQPSGGGSGRSRQLRLLPHWNLTISTTLTFDLRGNCIEGSGIPVDISVPYDPLPEGDPALERALKP